MFISKILNTFEVLLWSSRFVIFWVSLLEIEALPFFFRSFSLSVQNWRKLQKEKAVLNTLQGCCIALWNQKTEQMRAHGMQVAVYLNKTCACFWVKVEPFLRGSAVCDSTQANRAFVTHCWFTLVMQSFVRQLQTLQRHSFISSSIFSYLHTHTHTLQFSANKCI